MTSPRRSIAVVTGSRADYGLLRWIMEAIRASSELSLSVIATGMHFATDLGATYTAIEADGFEIAARVDMLLVGDTAQSMTKSVGVGVLGFCDALDRLRPDVLLLLGDRFEVFSAATAAMLLSIPIAHVHGGETTEGAVDESIRHAITKMAHIHFAAAAPYARRIQQMGENPANVHNVGAPGIEGIRRLQLLSRDALARSLDVTIGEKLFAVTYHPATLANHGPERAVQSLLDALDKHPDATIVCTRANADPAGRSINSMLEKYCEQRPNAHLFSSLGQLRYLSLLSHADVVIGNSSSGIIEAPFFRTPTVNIGDRQAGRLRAASVIDCEDGASAIASAIAMALSETFRASIENVSNPYGDGNTAQLVVDVLRSVDLGQLKKKRFYDV
jgi:UDP-N-acetylglucosamine 2-epimerase (non-hydrolysing)/GDP/UDP-N,N'-diacetylbacillosamine 2-epimerase (hydrolysing)